MWTGLVASGPMVPDRSASISKPLRALPMMGEGRRSVRGVRTPTAAPAAWGQLAQAQPAEIGTRLAQPGASGQAVEARGINAQQRALRVRHLRGRHHIALEGTRRRQPARDHRRCLRPNGFQERIDVDVPGGEARHPPNAESHLSRDLFGTALGNGQLAALGLGTGEVRPGDEERGALGRGKGGGLEAEALDAGERGERAGHLVRDLQEALDGAGRLRGMAPGERGQGGGTRDGRRPADRSEVREVGGEGGLIERADRRRLRAALRVGDRGRCAIGRRREVRRRRPRGGKLGEERLAHRPSSSSLRSIIRSSAWASIVISVGVRRSVAAKSEQWSISG